MVGSVTKHEVRVTCWICQKKNKPTLRERMVWRIAERRCSIDRSQRAGGTRRGGASDEVSFRPAVSVDGSRGHGRQH